MLRKLATFTLWLGLFALFLFFAAHSVGVVNLQILGGALILLLFSWLVLRRPQKRFQPSRRFRTLRRLGLLEGYEDEEEEDD